LNCFVSLFLLSNNSSSLEAVNHFVSSGIFQFILNISNIYEMDTNELEKDCPDLSRSVITTILQNPRYSQTFLRDMREERKRAESSTQKLVDELQQQFSWVPREIVEQVLRENGNNLDRALGPMVQRAEEFRQMQAAQMSCPVVELVVTSNTNVDCGEIIHVSWRLTGAEPTKYDWIGLFEKSKTNKEYVYYQWTRQVASGKAIFYAPNGFGEHEFRFFHGSDYYTHVAVSQPIFVGPIFEMKVIHNEKEILVRVVQRLGGIYPKAWVGLYLVGAPDSKYETYEWLGNRTEIRFAVPPAKKGATNNVDEYELRLFAVSYQRVATSNVIQIQRQ
jgi:hypothetical protein